MLGTTVDEFAIFDANAESVFHIVINIMWKTEVLLNLHLLMYRHPLFALYILKTVKLNYKIKYRSTMYPWRMVIEEYYADPKKSAPLYLNV